MKKIFSINGTTVVLNLAQVQKLKTWHAVGQFSWLTRALGLSPVDALALMRRL